MANVTLLFNPSHGIRFRAQPMSPLRSGTGPSSVCTYRRDAVQRCLAIRSEPNEGEQSQWNSKPNSEVSPEALALIDKLLAMPNGKKDGLLLKMNLGLMESPLPPLPRSPLEKYAALDMLNPILRKVKKNVALSPKEITAALQLMEFNKEVVRDIALSRQEKSAASRLQKSLMKGVMKGLRSRKNKKVVAGKKSDGPKNV